MWICIKISTYKLFEREGNIQLNVSYDTNFRIAAQLWKYFHEVVHFIKKWNAQCISKYVSRYENKFLIPFAVPPTWTSTAAILL